MSLKVVTAETQSAQRLKQLRIECREVRKENGTARIEAETGENFSHSSLLTSLPSLLINSSSLFLQIPLRFCGECPSELRCP